MTHRDGPEAAQAAEAILATQGAGRTRLRVLAHQHLSFSNALAIDLPNRTARFSEEVGLVQDLVRQHMRTIMPDSRVESTPGPFPDFDSTDDLDESPTEILTRVPSIDAPKAESADLENSGDGPPRIPPPKGDPFPR